MKACCLKVTLNFQYCNATALSLCDLNLQTTRQHFWKPINGKTTGT